MIKDFTPQQSPLYAIRPDDEAVLLVLGWTGRLADDELLTPRATELAPVVLALDEPGAQPFVLDGPATFSLQPWTPGRSAYWRNDAAPVTELWDAEGAQAETAALARPRSRQ